MPLGSAKMIAEMPHIIVKLDKERTNERSHLTSADHPDIYSRIPVRSKPPFFHGPTILTWWMPNIRPIFVYFDTLPYYIRVSRLFLCGAHSFSRRKSVGDPIAAKVFCCPDSSNCARCLCLCFRCVCSLLAIFAWFILVIKHITFRVTISFQRAYYAHVWLMHDTR